MDSASLREIYSQYGDNPYFSSAFDFNLEISLCMAKACIFLWQFGQRAETLSMES